MTLRVRMTTCCLWAGMSLLLLCGFPAWGQAQSSSSTPATAAKPAPTPSPAPTMDAPLDVKAAQPPSTDDLAAKGDPGGTSTGTVSDVVVSDAKKGLTLADERPRADVMTTPWSCGLKSIEKNTRMN